MKPKVLLILNRLNIGGLVPQVLYLAKYLQDDFETLLLSGNIQESEASSDYLLEELGIEPVFVPEMQRAIDPKKDYQAYKKIKKIIADYQPDIVHTHAAKPGALGRLAAANANVPAILHTFHGHVFHSYFGKAKTRFFLETERWLAKKSSAIVTISHLQKKELIEDFKLCPPEKMPVINYGYQLEKFYLDKENKRKAFRQKWQIASDEIIIGIIGRVVPIKNHALFLKGFKNVLEKYPRKVRALIIGDGEDRQKMEALADELNISYANQADPNAKVIFTSWITDIENTYAGLDLIALTSLNEGTPISLIEAQAAGLPIVSTDVGGVKDTILETENVLVAPSNDLDTFTKHLLTLLAKIENGTIDTSENRRFAMEKFGLEQMIQNMKDLYLSLL